MRLAMQMLKQAQPLLKIPTGYWKMEVFNPWRLPREKVLFIMGATGTGKSRLSIDLATRFSSEIINSDKIQVYKGLDIATNKVTVEEQCGFKHHLLGTVDPDANFTAKDFCVSATDAVESVHRQGKLPIIVGGSNSYIKSLVSDPKYGFGPRYDCCFLWVDVSVPVLHEFVSERVDKMVEAGLIEEVREVFDPDRTDYSRGIRRAIGVPELDAYFRAGDGSGREAELRRAVRRIKENNCRLVCRQLEKIHHLKHVKGWDLHRLDATEVLRRRSDEAWERAVVLPAVRVVGRFVSDGFAAREAAVVKRRNHVVEEIDRMVVSSL